VDHPFTEGVVLKVASPIIPIIHLLTIGLVCSLYSFMATDFVAVAISGKAWNPVCQRFFLHVHIIPTALGGMH
jgi:energy-converting hydrogenase Eha subunit C